MHPIEVDNLHKRFGETEALRGVSLSVQEGELFGLIGPDGAGKTTLMRIICTLLLPDEGTVRVAGMDVTREVARVRAILGYMPQRFSLYPDLTVEQNLRFFADLFQVPEGERRKRMEQLYRFSRLGPFRDRQAQALSGGMKQKLALSCALIHTPRILVLDEPTYGVDPVSRQEFWEILREIQQQGTTILVSTAYMEEADLCDRVALCFQGKVVALDVPAALKAGYPHPLFRLTGRELHRLRDFFETLPEVHSIQLFGDALHVSFTTPPGEGDWHRWREATGGNLQSWQPQEPTVEDVFLEAMREIP